MLNKAMLVLLLATLAGCTKVITQPEETLSDSIFGHYSVESGSDNLLDDLLTMNLTTVRQGNPGYIKIEAFEMNITFGAYNYLFDSVVLAGDNSFSVNQVIGDSLSSTGYARASGTGKFGPKTISLNFSIEREGTRGNGQVYMSGAKKIRDL